ncbi:ProQ/FINO family protein [Variovorax sp. HJSM1_2]|uniref:ProQ/FINO family protein n=1 Tax=Variovorax sp. HJSM1_2 TaxID=3366263 RepID=UPI003BDDFA93
MTDPQLTPAPQVTDAAAAPAAAVAAPGEATAAPAEAADAPRAERGRRGGRGGRNRRKPGAEAGTPNAAAGPREPRPPRQPRESREPRQNDGKGAQAPQTPRRTHPLLEQLAALYPHLFGAVFLPLKRGIFQDLQEAHPEVFEREALKVALGIHTRSTRYLQSVAEGRQRHDLLGNAVEAMAPEHVHHALLEVFRRRKPRDGEDTSEKLRRRLRQAFESSGLSREAYAELVRSRDEAANQLLNEVFAEITAEDAKAEALLRAFDASGRSSVEEFADMYGLDPRQTGRQLERARSLRPAVATAVAA